MPTCPKGHESADSDYCDECGTPIGAPPTPAPTGAPAAAPGPGQPAPASAGEPCPTCSTPRTGRFCEVCGYDFLAPELGGKAPGGDGGGAPGGAGAAGGGAGDRGAGDGGAGAGGGAPDAGGNPAPGQDPSPAGPLPTRQPPAASTWRVAVAADRAYHARMQAAADPGADQIAFPAYCPERRFALTGPRMLIGRQSRSRGIEPEIDLTGPPTDPAVSHAHAMLVAQPDGAWALVDLGSANGTYLNDGTDPLEENVPVPLSDGDRIHLGAFSTLTVRRA